MSILAKIKSGRQGRAQKVVIYAPEGFGKSTLASKFPEPLFLDVEDSTSQMDVSRLTREDVPTLKAFDAAIDEIRKARPGGTIIVDTVDWLEAMAVEAIVADAKSEKIQGIEDFGYGKGYVALKEKLTITLSKLDGLIAAGMHVVLLAHSKVVKFEPPDGAGPFDRYELKLSKHVAPLIKEWADMVIFGNWRTQVREKDKSESGQQFKGVGGKERQMHCVRQAAWDAKNRHGLADVEKWEIGVIERAFVSVGAQWGESVAGVPSVTPAAPKPAAVKPVAQPVALAAPDADDTIPMEHPAVTAVIEEIQAAQPETTTEPKAGVSADLIRICSPHSDKINAYLLSSNRIKKGQTWQHVDPVFESRILKNPAGFLKIALQEVAA